MWFSLGDGTLYNIDVRQCRSSHGGTARQKYHQPTQVVLLLEVYVQLHELKQSRQRFHCNGP